MHLVAVVLNELARQAVLLVNDTAHLGIHLLHGLLAHIGRFCDRAAQKHLALVLCVNHRPKRIGHPVTGHHVTSDLGGPLKIVAGASGHLLHENFFGNTPPKQHTDLVQHVLAVVAVAVLGRQAHGHTQSAAARNHGDLVHRVALGEQFAYQGMARLVVRSVPALGLGHDHAFALGAHQDLVFCLFKVLHFHRTGIAARCHQRSLITQICQISARHARGTPSDDAGIDILPQRHLSHVHIQNLLPATDIGQGDINLAIKPARAQQGRVQNVWPVGGCNHNHAHIGLKAVHLDEHLIEGLLAFVITASQAGTSLASDRINFIDEDDAGCVFLGVVKHVSNPRGSDSDEHFNEVRPRNREKRHLGLTGDALGQQGFASARRPNQQQTARNTTTQLLEFLRVFEKINHFLHFFFGLITTRNISKGDLVGAFIHHARLAFAKAEGPAFSAPLHLPHEIDPNPDQEQHGAPAHQQGHEQRAFFAGLDIEFDAIGNQVPDQATVQVGGRGSDFSVVIGNSQNFSAALTFLDHGTLDALAPNLFQKVRVAQVSGTGCAAGIELLEDSKQYQCDHKPDCYFRKPRIVQAELQLGHECHASTHLGLILVFSRCLGLSPTSPSP